MNTEAAEKAAPVVNQDASSANIAELASDWFTTKASRVGTITRLAAAEARLAVVSVALMVFLAVLGAIFVFSAWGLGVAALVNVLLGFGWSLWTIFLGLALTHVLIAALLLRATMRLGRNVEFRATRKSMFDPDNAES